MIKTTTALYKNTTYRFGGICNDFYTLNEKSEIDKMHNLNFDNEYFILGKGSNVVFSDNNYEYKDAITTIERIDQAVGQTVVGFDSVEQQVRQTGQLNYDVKHTTQQSHQNYRQKMNTSMEIVLEADLSLHAGDLIFCVGVYSIVSVCFI